MNGTPQVTITVQPDGQIRVQSNVPDPCRVLFLLDVAYDAMKASIQQPANGQIVAASATDLAGLNN